jgi:hypothetical protein
MGQPRPEPRAALLDATSLELSVLDGPVRRVSWLEAA